MHEREWTREELDRVWRLPEGWVWSNERDPKGYLRATDSGWHARRLDGFDSVWVWPEGLVGSMSDDPPAVVMLAVCEVALGLDSRETIAASFDKHAEEMAAKSKVGGGYSDILHAREAAGRAIEAQRCAAVVRRGTVES